jgi:hypothetical protein
VNDAKARLSALNAPTSRKETLDIAKAQVDLACHSRFGLRKCHPLDSGYLGFSLAK